MLIQTIVDYIPVTFFEFIHHFYFVFICLFQKNPDYYNKEIELYSKNIYNTYDYMVYGYSCRSLFHSLIDIIVADKDRDIRILTTPIHHTSFIKIMEQYIKPENIDIIKTNSNYNSINTSDNLELLKIEQHDEDRDKNIDTNYLNYYDVCIISHLFGQDFEIEEGFLETIKKNNPDCIFIEDRVQGGTFNKKFSSDIMDIALYSTGMDKKPCGLGGGLCYIKQTKEMDILYSKLKNKIMGYKEETPWDRFKFLVKKIPTYCLYNCRVIIYCVLYCFRLFNVDLNRFIKFYRKHNPGFTHNNYNYKPNRSLIKSINLSFKNYKTIETTLYSKSAYFQHNLKQYRCQPTIPSTEQIIKLLFPYLNPNPNPNEFVNRGSIYNTLSVFNPDNRTKFINHLNNKTIPIMENPTYKLFTHNYENKNQDRMFTDSLVYIPSLYNMTESEIIYLCNVIHEFYGWIYIID